MTWAGKISYPWRYVVLGTLLVLIVGSGVFFLSCPKSQADLMPSLLSQAVEAEKNGRLPEAAGLYEDILKASPESLPVYLKLGQLYFGMRLPAKAEEVYLKALEKGAPDPDILLYLGYIKESQGELDKAVAYYAKAELAGSRNPVLYFNMGNTYARLGDNAKALNALKRAVILSPNYMDAFVNLAIVSAQAGEKDDAVYYLEKAERLGYQAPAEFKQSLK
jgi:tetratricopeptide (TPR) repeat protein